MTDKQDPIAHAARLLREAAEELRQAHAYNNSEGWENETDAKAAYDEHMAAAQALEDWEAAIGAGGVQALSAAPEAIAKLRHLYQNMVNGAVRDTASAKRIAEGLLAPAIEALERATPPAEQQAAPKAAPGVGNSGFDHKTAADLLNNKTVSDEAVRKFVAASRWAHDERAALSATLLAMHGVLTSREAEIALLKKALLEAETATQQEAQEPAPSAAVFGLRLVPVEPTDQMVQAAHHIDLSYMPGQEGADRAAIYRAMLAAAPQPSPTAQADNKKKDPL